MGEFTSASSNSAKDLDAKIYVTTLSIYGKRHDDLTLVKGDTVQLIDASSADRWYVRQQRTGVKGYVLRQYLAEPGSLEAELWYFGAISRAEAENLLLKSVNKLGSYLIRESNGGGQQVLAPQQYSLSIRDNGYTIRHYRINVTGDGYFFLRRLFLFSNLRNLVNYYQNQAGGLFTNLKQPCSAPCQPEEKAEQAAVPAAVPASTLNLPKNPPPVGFFGKLMRVEAEEILRDPINPPKCFLLRESESKPKTLIISVNRSRKDDTLITHHIVMESHHGYSIKGIQRIFETYLSMIHFFRAQNILCCHMPDPAFIVYPPSNANEKGGNLLQFEWYRNQMTREEAVEKLLLPNNEDRSFLIRKSETYPGKYALSLRFENKVLHFKIHYCASTGSYCISSTNRFETLEKLVQYYKENALYSKALLITLGNAAV